MKAQKIIFSCLGVLALVGCSAKANENFILGLGGENVPVGQYASKILEYFGLDEQALAQKGVISYGEDVKAVTTQVKQGLVSAGIIYATDAKSANLKVVDTATKEMCGQVIYPAACISNSTGKLDAAKSFLAYLTSNEAMAVFESVGFSKVGDPQTPIAQVTSTITLNVYAAASMTETMNSIKTTYEAAHPNITLAMNYGSSGKLQTQIQEGRELCDLFISAGAKQMNALQDGEYIVNDTRINLLENKVALSVPDKNPAKINSFEDLKVKLQSYLDK